MAQSQTSLQSKLSAIDGVAKAYFQPPEGMKLVYPCIVYHINGRNTKRADNRAYGFLNMYTVTVIDRNPLSTIPDTVAEFEYCEFDRKIEKDNLNHTVFRLYY